MVKAINNKLNKKGTIMLIHCTCFSDDRQVMQYMGDRLKKEGYKIFAREVKQGVPTGGEYYFTDFGEVFNLIFIINFCRILHDKCHFSISRAEHSREQLF